MVGTRTSSLEVQIGKATRNLVTNHVDSIVGPMNKRLEGIPASLAQLLLQQQYANRGDVNSRFNRLRKMEFPKFHREDVKGWIALTWHLQFVKTYGDAVTWAEYQEAVFKRFGDANEDPMAELKNLRYKTTMKQYQSDFKALLNQLNITEAQAISMYIVGLPATIEINVRMFKPRSLEDDFSLSSLQETTLALVKQRYNPILSTPRTTTSTFVNMNVSYPTKNTSTLALPAPISQTVTKCNPVFRGRPRKMLSQKEYDEKRNKREEEEVFEDCLEEESSAMTDQENGLSYQENLPFECFSGWRKQINQSIYGKRFPMEDTRGKKIVLRGTNQSELTWMSGKSFSKKFNHQDAYVASICCMVPSATLQLMHSNVDSGMGGNKELQALLEEYAHVFEEPKTLPPHRSFDHQIPLRDRDVNVNVRPYRSSSVFQVGSQIEIPPDKNEGKDVYKTAFKSHEGHYEFVVMPFGLTNAPSTFQALMNYVFKPFLRKSKCVFGTSTVEYLGHVISGMGVAIDPRYYRRFIKGYAVISQPLTALLKKNAFQWNSQTQTAFEKLKQAMVNPSVLALPNFDKEFIIKTDASGVSVGAVLQQQGHPVAYLSKTLATKHQSLSAYEKELLAVVMALQKWRGLLQPLPIPQRIWQVISMDFIDSMPMSQVENVISIPAQTDGQTKVVNKCLEGYLRCMTGEKPKDRVKWLPLAEYWYNANFHSSINNTPYEVVYGQPPPLHIPYVAKDSNVEAMDRTLQAR
nr:gypsy/Ty3 retroelement polyprotein [Tanacetum cinerariifolium]